MVKKHLAILNRQAIKAIIQGEKTLEARFSKKRIVPFNSVSVGDVVYMKPPGEELAGQFEVVKVISIEGLDRGDWQWIKETYRGQIFLGTDAETTNYFKEHQDCRYATIIYIGKVEQFITSPIKIQKKDLRGWMVLENV